ncbi:MULTISPECIES: PTS sugar transporter subunit IIA [Mesobacillus]|uniref:PTS glucose transporter subunit IIA n=2 Tax=Mesobacillus TaxID=2675231 RepID=A0A0D6ZAB2_9BACI|nr:MULTISPECIES: PTS glucose transporter subunit IIA [Mesobacillus]KIY22265.1 PTS glucose transporter subunit IIA [Mesobacillus subterraneus]MDQ0412000.1 PTS system glucose-specific IIA component [Mesobacillus stamsii]
MFKKLFGKKEEPIKTIQILAPITGKAVHLNEVPDPVFSEKMMGDGLAIEPAEGIVVAPVDGEIIQVFPTKHAIGIRARNGAEILIHIGLETVSLKGEGFETHVKQGDQVKAGQKLVTFDMEIIREKAKSTITPIIITNTDQAASVKKWTESNVERGSTPILEVTFE